MYSDVVWVEEWLDRGVGVWRWLCDQLGSGVKSRKLSGDKIQEVE